jgi:hypothetical protein
MRTQLAMALVLGATALLTAGASAQAPGSKEEDAHAAFEAGAEALKAKDYETAATHFETAFDLVPSAEALRGAIRARSRAGQGDRAATLAALGLRRFPDSDKLVKTANEALAELRPGLHRLKVTCSKACLLTVGGKRVLGEAAKEAELYLAPGKRTIGASFPDGSGADEQVIGAKAGGENSIHFMSRAPAVASSGAGTEGATPEPSGTASAEPPKASGSSSATPEPGETPPEDEKAPDAKESWHGVSPALFFVGLGVTAVLGGVTIWSGVDTLNNPGQDVVRQKCQGLGTDCPEYKDGRAKQVRTNALIGVTAGLGGLTAIIGLFLTDWKPDEPPKDEPPKASVVLVPDGESGMAVRARF